MRLALMIFLGFWCFIFAFNTVAVDPLPGKALMLALCALSVWLFTLAYKMPVR